MGTPVIIDTLRTPFGKRGGALAGVHPAHLLGKVLRRILERNEIDPAAVGIVVGGCVTLVGEQGLNVTRIAWLAENLPVAVGAFTVDAACGGSQQAVHQVHAMIACGMVDVGIACGVESLSRVPIGASTMHGPGRVKPEGFPHSLPNQFRGAERVAEKYVLTREAIDAYSLRSQARARSAALCGETATELTPVEAADGALLLDRDECVRDSSLAALAALAPVVEGGLHTAGSASQLSDGASAVLIADLSWAQAHGARARGRVAHQALVGSDPYLHLEGPIDATRRLLANSGSSIADFDEFEINEAFASVPLAWLSVFDPPEERLNGRGGAIAIGHPMGASGARLIASALAALERSGGERALVAMCCGGAVGTGSIIERV